MKKKEERKRKNPESINLQQSNFLNNKTSIWPAALIIAFMTFLVYLPALKNGFVYDDMFTIVDNMFIRDFGNLSKIFTQEYFFISGEKTYRPIVTITYYIDFLLYGLNPWGYHLTNILLHAVNGILFYLFLVLMVNGYPKFIPLSLFQRRGQGNTTLAKEEGGGFHGYLNIPLIISILFVTHPVLTEAVNAISYREDILVFLFYITTLNLYLLLQGRPGHGNALYIISFFTYFLALLSKEMALTLPNIALRLDI